MKTIFKYVLDISLGDQFVVQMSVGAKVLCAREQHNEVCIWAEVEPSGATSARRFTLVGTGHVVPDNARYIGTAHIDGGRLILHVYERP